MSFLQFNITRRLVIGAAIFGVGWGLSGICPGPGIVLAGSLNIGGLVFVAAVIVGSLLHQGGSRKSMIRQQELRMHRPDIALEPTLGNKSRHYEKSDYGHYSAAGRARVCSD